jgi:hypothetical protein
MAVGPEKYIRGRLARRFHATLVAGNEMSRIGYFLGSILLVGEKVRRALVAHLGLSGGDLIPDMRGEVWPAVDRGQRPQHLLDRRFESGCRWVDLHIDDQFGRRARLGEQLNRFRSPNNRSGRRNAPGGWIDSAEHDVVRRRLIGTVAGPLRDHRVGRNRPDRFHRWLHRDRRLRCRNSVHRTLHHRVRSPTRTDDGHIADRIRLGVRRTTVA